MADTLTPAEKLAYVARNDAECADHRTDATVTMTFNYDIRSFDGNPHKAATPFGRPEMIGVGNAFSDLDRSETEVERLRKRVAELEEAALSARRTLANLDFCEADPEIKIIDQALGGDAGGVAAIVRQDTVDRMASALATMKLSEGKREFAKAVLLACAQHLDRSLASERALQEDQQ